MDAERKRVNGLRRNALLEELEGYDLDTTGNVTVLRNRLLQFLADRIQENERETTAQNTPNLGEIMDAIGALSANIDQRFQQRDGELDARMKKLEDAVQLLSDARNVSSNRIPEITVQPEETSSSQTDSTKLNQGKLCDMARKWNLKFDGKQGAVSFLERLKELQRAYGIEDQKILNLLPELFTGTATLWYRNHHYQWSTWKDFLQHFIEYFFPLNYHRHLMSEIQNRTQGPGEKVREYFEALGTLMRRHGKLTEDEQNEWFFHNLRPEYKLYVRRQNATDQISLLKLAIEFEETQEENQKYRPPPDVSDSFMAETAFKGKSAKSEKAKLASVSGNTEDKEKRPKKCKNCLKDGHYWKQCREPRRLYCYGCGKDGVTVRTCGCRDQSNQSTQSNQSGPGNGSTV